MTDGKMSSAVTYNDNWRQHPDAFDEIRAALSGLEPIERTITADFSQFSDAPDITLKLMPSNDHQRAYMPTPQGYALFSLKHREPDENGNNCTITVEANVETLYEAETWIGKADGPQVGDKYRDYLKRLLHIRGFVDEWVVFRYWKKHKYWEYACEQAWFFDPSEGFVTKVTSRKKAATEADSGSE